MSHDDRSESFDAIADREAHATGTDERGTAGPPGIGRITEALDPARVIAEAEELIARGGKIAVAQGPVLVDGAQRAISEARHEVDSLSDQGVIAAAAFAGGVATGLFLAGAPRLVLGLAAVPMGYMLWVAGKRGVRPNRFLRRPHEIEAV